MPPERTHILKRLDRYAAMLERSGIDYRTLKLILRVKLLMDLRRIPTVFSSNNKVKENSNQFKRSLIYGVYGAVQWPYIAASPCVPKAQYYHRYCHILLMSTMISIFHQFCWMSKKNILLPVVDQKTLNAQSNTYHILPLYITGAGRAFADNRHPEARHPVSCCIPAGYTDLRLSCFHFNPLYIHTRFLRRRKVEGCDQLLPDSALLRL